MALRKGMIAVMPKAKAEIDDGGMCTLAHLTDLHVACDGHATAVLKDRSIEILHDLVEQVSALEVNATIFGGDNIDNRGTGLEDLEVFARAVERLPRPSFCLLGNHESGAACVGRVTKERFANRLAGYGLSGGRFNFTAGLGAVRLIGLDTTLVGATGGYIAPGTLRFLSQALKEAVEPHIIVVGHHLLVRPWEPFFLESWDADYLVANREPALSLLLAHPRVRAYLCGHHHASRIEPVRAPGGGGLYHILTASPSAFPHTARLIRFEPTGMHVSVLRPRCPDLIEQGRRAVLTGRKARRYSSLGSLQSFLAYIEGRPTDNEVFLPYDHSLYDASRYDPSLCAPRLDAAQLAAGAGPAMSDDGDRPAATP